MSSISPKIQNHLLPMAVRSSGNHQKDGWMTIEIMVETSTFNWYWLRIWPLTGSSIQKTIKWLRELLWHLLTREENNLIGVWIGTEGNKFRLQAIFFRCCARLSLLVFSTCENTSRDIVSLKNCSKIGAKVTHILHYRWAEGSGLVRSQLRIRGDHTTRCKES